MFERTKKISLFDLRDKLLHRANLLYSDMKNKFEELEEQKYEKEKENAISLLNKTEEELKKKLEIEKTNENKGVKDYEKTADLLYTTMKNKEENNINKIEKKINEINKIDKNNNLNHDNSIFTNEEIKKAREFITNGEGFSQNAYQDIGGVWTIGYGHIKNVKRGDKITLEEAEELYKTDFEEHIKPLREVKVPLNNNQKIALASLIYNIGPNAFKKSTLLKKLNNNDFNGAADEFDRWIYDNGKKSNGLVNRRKKEKELFISQNK